MGVDLSIYRRLIGTYGRRKSTQKTSGGVLEIDTSNVWVIGTLIMVLLVIGGVEINPGPDRGYEEQSSGSWEAALENFIREQIEWRNEMEYDFRNMSDQVEKTNKDWKTIKEETDKIKEENTKLKADLEKTKEENSKLQGEIETLDNNTRKKNLIIMGIKEKDNESRDDTREIVVKFFEDYLECNFTELHIEDAFRIGVNDRKRMICVQFTSLLMKELVIKKRKLLKGTDIWLDHDYCRKTRDVRKVLKPYMFEARKNGIYSILVRDKILIDHKLVNIDYCKKNFDKVSNSENEQEISEGGNPESTLNQEMEREKGDASVKVPSVTTRKTVRQERVLNPAKESNISKKVNVKQNKSMQANICVKEIKLNAKLQKSGRQKERGR